MKLTAKFFDELSSSELYEILKSRARIFVFEQGIKYVDEDDTDYDSLHCFFMENGVVTAYLRAKARRKFLPKTRICYDFGRIP